MNIFDALILGGLQGITEFLPISSSGHLVLAEHFLGLKVETLKSFDVVVHMGTLLSIFVYFRKDIWGMILAVWKFFRAQLKPNDPYGKLIIYIIVGTIPAVFAGLYGEEWIDSKFRNVQSVALNMMIVGGVFILGEFVYKYLKSRAGFTERIAEKFEKEGELHGMKWQKALVIGLAQAVALLPGVSRSGSTIVAGLFQGIERSTAARFSFLLGMPAMAGAGILTVMKISGSGNGPEIPLFILAIGFLSAFVFGLLSVSFLMNFLKRFSLNVFAVYLIILGILVYF